jgi:acetyltransferase EpsM
VKAIVNNIEPTEEQWNNLHRRISLLDYNVPVVGIADFRPSSNDKYCYGFFNGRHKLIEHVKKTYNITFPPLIHSKAYLGSGVKVGEGVIIGPHAVIAPNVKIGDFCIINRGLNIGHDTELGDYCTIAPGASIAGMVRIGSKSTVGIGATIIDGLTIGMNSFVGAGAVVVKDVPDNVVVAGVPAKVMRKNEG